MRCREEDDYHGQLALLLAERHQCPEVATALAHNLLELPGDFEHLYFLTKCSYWPREFSFESHVRECQKTFGGWRNVDFLEGGHRTGPSNTVTFHSGGSCLSHPLSNSSVCPSCWLIIVASRCGTPSRIRPGYEKLR